MDVCYVEISVCEICMYIFKLTSHDTSKLDQCVNCYHFFILLGKLSKKEVQYRVNLSINKTVASSHFKSIFIVHGAQIFKHLTANSDTFGCKHLVQINNTHLPMHPCQ